MRHFVSLAWCKHNLVPTTRMDKPTNIIHQQSHNIVNASEVLDTYGADVIRLYIMFLGPLE
ncbi:MAG: hypothetical protein Q8847_02745, partial [Sweet potato little leaf phytoplasma]|nr:hypothetical protein [Sweet potato little leaf phytoplasma]